MSERWLVTGARGFLGRRVCPALRHRGFEVVPLDRTPPAQESGLVADLKRRHYIGIGPGDARRSLVLAADVAAALPSLAQQEGVFHLTDRAHPTFLELETAICKHLGRRPPRRIPLGLARALGRLGDMAQRLGVPTPFTTKTFESTTNTLTFDDSRASKQIGWAPRAVLDHLDRWMSQDQGSTGVGS